MQDGRVTDDLDPRQMAAEDLMLAMRMTRGVDADLLSRAEKASSENARAVLEELVMRGLASHDIPSDAYRPTRARMALRQRGFTAHSTTWLLEMSRLRFPLAVRLAFFSTLRLRLLVYPVGIIKDPKLDKARS